VVGLCCRRWLRLLRESPAIWWRAKRLPGEAALHAAKLEDEGAGLIPPESRPFLAGVRRLVCYQHFSVNPVRHPHDLSALLREDGVREAAIFKELETNPFVRDASKPLPNQPGSIGVGSG